jgi:hypothetical protein
MSTYSDSGSLRPLTRGSTAPSSPSISESGTAVESNGRSPSRNCSVYEDCKLNYEYNGVAKTPEKPCHGWPELTDHIVKNPGFESFQSFRDLNIKSLLYFQAELCSLRRQLHELEWKDHRSGNFSHAEHLCANVEFLVDSEFGQTKRGGKQMRLVKRIRAVLKEYSNILISNCCDVR